VPGVPGSPRAERPDNEEEVTQDGDHDGDHVESDPAPLVLVVNGVGAGSRHTHIFTDRGEGLFEGILGTHDSAQISNASVENLRVWRGVHVQLALLVHLDLRFLSMTYRQILDAVVGLS